MVEYTEMPEEEKNNPAHRFCNLSLFCLKIDFVKKIASLPLPYHAVFKALSPSLIPNAWKFETFIFDILPFSTKTSLLIYPRKEVFAPLKSKEDIPLVEQLLTH